MDIQQVYDTLVGTLPDGATLVDAEVKLDHDFEPDIERTRELGYNASRYTGYSTLTVKLVWYDPKKDQRRSDNG